MHLNPQTNIWYSYISLLICHPSQRMNVWPPPSNTTCTIIRNLTQQLPTLKHTETPPFHLTMTKKILHLNRPNPTNTDWQRHYLDYQGSIWIQSYPKYFLYADYFTTITPPKWHHWNQVHQRPPTQWLLKISVQENFDNPPTAKLIHKLLPPSPTTNHHTVWPGLLSITRQVTPPDNPHENGT